MTGGGAPLIGLPSQQLHSHHATVSDIIITWDFEIVLLLRNVSFGAITSITFSLRYNYSFLHFGLIPWQFQNKSVCTHQIDQRIPVMVEDALRWLTMGETSCKYFKILWI